MFATAAFPRTALTLLIAAWSIGAAPVSAATMHPRSVALLDPLGTGCVDGGGIDDPFPAAKGIRPPPFCLPDPCLAALPREELAFRIVGRPVSQDEWDAYYSRYAETCRAEALNPDTAPIPRTVEDFWAPLTQPGGGPALVATGAGAALPLPLLAAAGGRIDAGTDIVPPGSLLPGPEPTDPVVKVGGDGGGTPPPGEPGGDGGTRTPGPGAPDDPDGPGEGPLPVVPLPPSLLMLLAALGLLPFAFRRTDAS